MSPPRSYRASRSSRGKGAAFALELALDDVGKGVVGGVNGKVEAASFRQGDVEVEGGEKVNTGEVRPFDPIITLIWASSSLRTGVSSRSWMRPWMDRRIFQRLGC